MLQLGQYSRYSNCEGHSVKDQAHCGGLALAKTQLQTSCLFLSLQPCSRIMGENRTERNEKVCGSRQNDRMTCAGIYLKDQFQSSA